MTDPALWSAAERAAFDARRRSRNLALGILLAALTVLFFGITMVRMVPPSGEVQAKLQAQKPGWDGR
ncbi:hypothetical protein GCM10007973_09800 [Polymorphobacter multimanifer]|uniref:Uncharacterized protein n=1 Tax=Polymorphobacter multimanifer TaxID=1070431 RepID=A0A841L4Q3_9SPHN|nr:hypothetical protein [Polymorphobacter multimanifer]MBB6227627.1 hypothetical protein [Polymorphobacter multimanifer]GGI74968.1 hypothetical protein GCM10007973_09800 [Polymorphobacter multimanifer]